MLMDHVPEPPKGGGEPEPKPVVPMVSIQWFESPEDAAEDHKMADQRSEDQRSADEHLTHDEIEALLVAHLDRQLVVVGASTGSDTHTVGIDAILNLKGYDGHHGLEAYRGFRAYNMGSQVANGDLIAKAIEVDADAILVSQTVTQQGLHVGNLTQLVDMIEAEGLRDRVVLCCGGPLITDELAKELGYDAGFSKGTYPHHVAAYLARTAIERSDAETAVAGG